jgi:hypothetical protein
MGDSFLENIEFMAVQAGVDFAFGKSVRSASYAIRIPTRGPESKAFQIHLPDLWGECYAKTAPTRIREGIFVSIPPSEVRQLSAGRRAKRAGLAKRIRLSNRFLDLRNFRRLPTFPATSLG